MRGRAARTLAPDIGSSDRASVHVWLAVWRPCATVHLELVPQQGEQSEAHMGSMPRHRHSLLPFAAGFLCCLTAMDFGLAGTLPACESDPRPGSRRGTVSWQPFVASRRYTARRIRGVRASRRAVEACGKAKAAKPWQPAAAPGSRS